MVFTSQSLVSVCEAGNSLRQGIVILFYLICHPLSRPLSRGNCQFQDDIRYLFGENKSAPNPVHCRPATLQRTWDSRGHSPLDQITRHNVQDLELAWSWALPSGASMMAPIVHDGVLFAYSFGDVLQALDATTGDLLWGFHRTRLHSYPHHKHCCRDQSATCRGYVVGVRGNQFPNQDIR